MSSTYDLNTPVGMVRLNTFGDDSNNPIFQDEELTAFYLQESSNVKLAAARVLEVVGSREAYIQKVITNLGLTTNGAALAAEFRAQAKALRDQVANPVTPPTDGVEDYFDIAEQVVDHFTYRERLLKQVLRGEE